MVSFAASVRICFLWSQLRYPYPECGLKCLFHGPSSNRSRTVPSQSFQVPPGIVAPLHIMQGKSPEAALRGSDVVE